MEKFNQRAVNLFVKKLKQDTSGFTLVEMLVVLMVLAVISSVTLVYLPGRHQRTQMETLARDVMTGVIHSRNMAVRSHQDALFTIDFAQGEYWTEGAYGENQARGRFPDNVAVEMHTAEGEVSPGHRAAIRFFPDGSSTGGYISLKQGAQTYKISVNWLTGKVDIENERP